MTARERVAIGRGIVDCRSSHQMASDRREPSRRRRAPSMSSCCSAHSQPQPRAHSQAPVRPGAFRPSTTRAQVEAPLAPSWATTPQPAPIAAADPAATLPGSASPVGSTNGVNARIRMLAPNLAHCEGTTKVWALASRPMGGVLEAGSRQTRPSSSMAPTTGTSSTEETATPSCPSRARRECGSSAAGRGGTAGSAAGEGVLMGSIRRHESRADTAERLSVDDPVR